MKKLKTVITIVFMLISMLAFTKNTTAQTLEMQTFFSSDYAGISVQVNASREAKPGENITINLWLNCTADGVYMDCLNLSVYGYRHFKYDLEEILLNVTCVIENSFLTYNSTSECNYVVPIPNDVWDVTYAELRLKYTIKGLPLEYNPSFSITIVRNVLWEELEEQLNSLNQSYQQLNDTYWQLNSSYEQLNQTYWELAQNYTALRGSLNELDNTRRAVALLVITTIFFVATTIYLMLRKPKEYW